MCCARDILTESRLRLHNEVRDEFGLHKLYFRQSINKKKTKHIFLVESSTNLLSNVNLQLFCIILFLFYVCELILYVKCAQVKWRFDLMNWNMFFLLWNALNQTIFIDRFCHETLIFNIWLLVNEFWIDPYIASYKAHVNCNSDVGFWCTTRGTYMESNYWRILP